ncbi:hypothetical protein K438DRAFT_1980850 [Mycena galopus ATCC 62051]|nr:hypothetical protein K438DRAFT_1980850 [Mycena galopus ATCC 62051]
MEAYSGPTFYADNAEALKIKETANIHFRAGEYKKALEIYTSIINTYSKRVMVETIRVARCNRAACYLHLGEYQRCIDECHIVLMYIGSPALMEKARHRLVKADLALDDIDAQKRALDPTYPGRPKYDVQERIREQLEEASVSSAKFQDRDVEEHRPFAYVVRMKEHDPEYVHMRDMVPIGLMLEPSSDARDAYEARRDAFVRNIVATHEPELMGKHPWTCFSCKKPATAWIHSLISDLASFYPLLKDYARPICEKGGNCERITRLAMARAEKYDPEIMREEGVRIEM